MVEVRDRHNGTTKLDISNEVIPARKPMEITPRWKKFCPAKELSHSIVGSSPDEVQRCGSCAQIAAQERGFYR